MKRIVIATAAVLLMACSPGSEQAAATQTSVIIYGGEQNVRKPVTVRNFGIDTETVRRGQPARLRVELDAARPAQQVSVDWFGPDGWLVTYQSRPASEARFELPVPMQSLDQPGQYRAVLRSGGTVLAEDSLTVTG